jgi:hypothetical protein
MSGLVTGIILDRYPGGAGERLVAVALGDCAHRDGTRIFPSINEVADRTRLSRRTVQLHLAKMVAAGWLILVRKSTGRRGDTNEYRISPEWLAGGDCVPPDAPVLRTNAKGAGKVWGANIAPHTDARWGAASDTVGCNLTRGGVKPIAPKPSLTVIEPNTPLPPTGGAPGFESFFAEYPRQVDEVKARKEWERLSPDGDTAAVIVASVRAWTRSPEWQRDNGRYIPKPNNWLRNRRWRDVPGVVSPQPAAVVPLPREPELTNEQLEANKAKAREAVAHARRVLRSRQEVAA